MSSSETPTTAVSDSRGMPGHNSATAVPTSRAPKTNPICSMPSEGMSTNVVPKAPRMLPIVPTAYTCPEARPTAVVSESSAA